MPIYEYQCNGCSSEFEELILAGPVERVVCPRCGSEDSTKLVSTFGFRSGGGDRGADSRAAAGSCCAGGGCACRH